MAVYYCYTLSLVTLLSKYVLRSSSFSPYNLALVTWTYIIRSFGTLMQLGDGKDTIKSAMSTISCFIDK